MTAPNSDAPAPMTGIADPPLPYEGGRVIVSDEELALARRRVLRLYILAPALSVAALLVGFARAWPALAAGGVFGLGVTALVVGSLAMAERRLTFIVRSLRLYRTQYVLYEGFAAVPFGLAWVVAGLTAIAAAIVFLLGTSPQGLRELLLARPGHALVPAGAFLCASGLGYVIGFSRRTGSPGRRLFNLLLEAPARLGGVILLFWGVAALALGLYEWLLPGAFDRAVAELARGRLPFGR